MIKNILIILILVFGFSFSEVSHSRLTGTNIHTVYRWQFADSAARVNQSVVAADTMKLGYQRSDSTSWVLVATTGAKWKKIAYASNQNTLTTSNVSFGSGAFSGALTGTTLNTGYGANELYAMDQNVRSTDSINALTNKATRGHFDSLQLGSGSFLKTYVEGSFPCTLKTSDVTVQQIGTAYYTKVGNVLTMSFPSLTGTSNSSGLTLYFTIPYLPKQQLSGYGFNKVSITATDNGATVNTTAQLTGNPAFTNRLSVNIIPSASFTSSGTKGFAPFSISYITE